MESLSLWSLVLGGLVIVAQILHGASHLNDAHMQYLLVLHG